MIVSHVSFSPHSGVNAFTPGRPLRAASVMKPLLFWAGAGIEGWDELAKPAVTLSSNEPTDHLWDAVGGERLLDRLEELTGLRGEIDERADLDRHPWGKLMVDASGLVQGYTALKDAGDPEAEQLLAWMREVPERQTFGLRSAWPGSAIKCGWFLDEDETALRTHAVLVSPRGRVAAVMTQVEVPPEVREEYGRQYHTGDEVLHLHEAYAGEQIRAAISR